MPDIQGKLLSIQVGLPEQKVFQHPSDGKEAAYVSGIDKSSVLGAVEVGVTNLAGDGQADLENHGGPHRAILMYSANHYPDWKQLRGLSLAYGAFGENFTVSGLTEDNMCLGDTLKVGEVILQVSQPRSPCWKLGRKHHLPQLPADVERFGWTGWYVRVLQTGTVEAGMEIRLIHRLHPQWTIRQTHKIRRDSLVMPEDALALAACTELSPDWRRMLSGN
ncbi:MOSC domain-containing protein [Alicyclobacillus curvatus]|nr:MOSC domain-containing protein [Alicyclobacillus curvatus]